MCQLKLGHHVNHGSTGPPFGPIVGLSSAHLRTRLAVFEPRIYQSRAQALNFQTTEPAPNGLMPNPARWDRECALP